MSSIPEWILHNPIELFGAATGILYIFLSVRQHILTWPVGLVSSAFYIIVFMKAGIYAMMLLQLYYFGISIYGWYYWLRGNKGDDNTKNVPVLTMSRKGYVLLAIISGTIFIFIYLILTRFTDTTVPLADSFTTSLSIVATWMLARKYIENWLIWIFVDIILAALFIYKGLWPTVALYSVYTVMAFIGYYKWKKDLKSPEIG